MLDATPHEEQKTSIGHLTKLVRLQWLPRMVPVEGLQRARQLAFEAICTTDPTELRAPQSIKKQKEAAKRAAIAEWEKRYYNNPRTTMAFKTALQNPPDGKAHHTLTSNQPPKNREARANEHPETKNQSHAFTGEYTKRFYPPHTQEQIACPCGDHCKQSNTYSSNAPSTQPHDEGISLPTAGPERYPNSSPTRSAYKKYFGFWRRRSLR
ncbi:hypothetical protein BGY98DRAFT_939093 [Russula aff. rugulosa BPL654]|nr:hypothetical protein BGY98DRAFT_939093 [Russula aff. rugulosa BPL654]